MRRHSDSCSCPKLVDREQHEQDSKGWLSSY